MINNAKYVFIEHDKVHMHLLILSTFGVRYTLRYTTT